GYARVSLTCLSLYPGFDGVRDAAELLVAPVYLAIEVFRDRFHLRRVLHRCEVDHHIQRGAAERGLGHERADADVARGHRACTRGAALARAEEPTRGLGDLEGHPGRGQERGLHALLTLLFLVVGLAREVPRRGDARVRGAVVVDQT